MPSRASRQPTAPAREGHKAEDTRQVTRGMVPPRPPSVAPTPLPLGGVREDAESAHKPSISRAISRGRIGVVDVQGLLTRQPSVHPPVRARTPSGRVEQLQQQRDLATTPALMSLFAANTAAETGQLTHGRSLTALPPLTAGTAVTSGIAVTAGIAPTGLDIQKKSPSRLPLSTLQERVSTAASALGHLPADAPALRASPLPQGQADSAASSQLRLANADGLSANPSGVQLLTGSIAQPDIAGDQGSKAVSMLSNLADASQQSSTDSTRLRHEAPSPSLQLSLLDAAPVKDDGVGEGQQAKPSVALTAQSSETPTQEANRPSMAHLAQRVGNNSSMPTHTSAKGAEQVLHSASDGLSGVLDSMHSRQDSYLSSSSSRTKSVTFGGAQALALQPGSQGIASRSALGQQQYELVCSPQGLTQHHRALGQEGQSSGSSSGSALVRLSSSLSTAVTETMQDRMLAGGMMHTQTENMHADRCPWLRNTVKDGSLAQDRCTWPRSILKHTANEVPGSLETSRVADTANSNVGAARDGRRSMPPQLARHQSSLNQVSRRPDFAAAMNAVRTSWRAEQIGQLEEESTLANDTSENVHDVIRTAAVAQGEQSSLDAIWASIRHQQ